MANRSTGQDIPLADTDIPPPSSLKDHAVMTRNTDPMSTSPAKPADARDSNDHWQVSLVTVPSGVAAGRTRRVHGNAHTESWALFATREQFDACAETDPLRFADPGLFAKIKREFDHVFDQSSSRHFHS